MHSQKLKIGLLVDSTLVSKYVYELTQWAKNQTEIEISHLIIRNSPYGKSIRNQLKNLRHKSIMNILASINFRIISKIESLFLKQQPIHANHLSKFKLPKFENEIYVIPNVSNNGRRLSYSKEDIERIKNEKIDVLIRCGSGILTGEILNASSYGVFSFHHGDNRVNRGGPAGFWEVYLKSANTGFVIQKLTEELDGGDVLFRGSFPTSRYYLLNQANVLLRSNHFLKEFLLRLANTRPSQLQIEKKFPYSSRLYRMPSIRIQINYLMKNFFHYIFKFGKIKIFPANDKWTVAYQRRNWQNLVMWKSIQIPNPKGRFLADPFVIKTSLGDYCFVEDFEYRTNKGSISVIRLENVAVPKIKKVIEESFHMSFPFLFKYNDIIYMIPETHEKNQIRVYECEHFPYKWKLKEIIMDNISAADSMVFFKNGTWWLFTNVDPLGLSEHSSILQIYYSTNPLSKNWISHPQNPIYIDPTVARNAGLLFDGDQIYRVAQVQRFGKYGAAAKIMQIDQLDMDIYRESLVSQIEPGFLNARRTHHMYADSDITVFDFFK